jgi:hypothetical protein
VATSSDLHHGHLDLRAVTLLGYRVAAAGVLGTMAGIHLYLWNSGYRYIHMIGILFLLNAIGGGVLALAVLATPNRWLWIASALSALFMIGTLGALILSLTVGIFGFQEYWNAPLVPTTIYVEAGGGLGLAVQSWLGWAGFRASRRP